jgi:hypothetical protein
MREIRRQELQSVRQKAQARKKYGPRITFYQGKDEVALGASDPSTFLEDP